MPAKQVEAELKISGELDASLRQAIKDAEANMDQLTEAARQGEGAMGALSDMVKKQGQTLNAAKTQYASYVLSGNEATEEAQALAQGIANLTADLNKNKSALKAAEQAANELANGLNDSGNKADDSGGKLRKMGENGKKALENIDALKLGARALASAGFSFMASKITDATKALFDLAQSTQEVRQFMASTETAFNQAGLTSEQAGNTLSDFYAIVGDEDQAAEAANNVARMATSQQDLDKWTKILTGTWGIYEKALPIENLAEAADETAKTGKVVGGLADALNWSSEAAVMFADYMNEDVTTAEDAFNAALEECSTEQERQALITNTLLALYGDAADEYERNAGGLMDARRATIELMKAQGNLAEIVEPVTTAWTLFKTKMLEAVAPALEVIAEKAKDVLEWMQQHPNVMKSVAAALLVLAAGFTAVTFAITVFAAVQLLAAAGMMPFIMVAIGVVAALALAAAGVVLLTNKLGGLNTMMQNVKEFFINAWETIKNTVVTTATIVATVIQTKWTVLVGIVQSIWNNITSALQGVWNGIKIKASSFAQSVVNKIRSTWSTLTNILMAPFRAVSGIIDNVSGKIGRLLGKVQSVGSSVLANLPHFASGGFTSGVSIAGEAGTEAVISFDPRHRAENLRYWSQAGAMLGADVDDMSLSRTPRTVTSRSVGKIEFNPNITINGNASKDDVIAAIRAVYPEFMDLVEEVLEDRKVGAYE